MANPEHIQILKQGVEVWNTWRSENPDITPDLTNASLSNTQIDLQDRRYAMLRGEDVPFEWTRRQTWLTSANFRNAALSGIEFSDSILRNADFYGSDLEHARLSRANLSGANLYGAKLSGANLDSADLHGANLEKAILVFVILFEAKLVEANLSGADLSNGMLHKANLSRVNLHNADLSGAYLDKTIFANLNLASTRGLELCDHRGSSVLDFQTLQKSGTLPVSFLRGVGLPDTLINGLPSLLKHTGKYYSCFISYSSKDQAFVDCLYTDLQNNGVRCWFARRDMKIGDKIRQRIDESIRAHDKLMIILSEHSLQSDWVESEVESALEKEQQKKNSALFPIRVDHAVMDTNQAWAADIRRKRHIGNFSNWKDHDSYKKAFDRLLRDLKESG